MKQSLLRAATVVGLLLTLAGSHLRAIAKEPTIDDRFRDGASETPVAELPLLNPQQSKLARDNPEAGDISGPAYFGVTFTEDERTAVVRTVAPGSPADQAGLKPRDVIETIQGITINSPQDIVDLIAKMRPGTMLDIGVSRRVSVHAQAPLAILPGAATRSVGYPPDLSNGSYNAPANYEHELIPVPSNAQRNTSVAKPQPNRNTAAPRQSAPASNQRRSSNQNNNKADDNRGLLGRGRRR